MELKDKLKFLRKQRNLTAQQVADNCEISLGVYKKYESGERGVGVPALIKIADFYHVTTDYLLGREPATDPFDMLQLPEDQKSVMERFASFPDDVRAIILDAIKELAEAAKKRQRLNTNAETTTVATAAQNGGVPKIVEMSNEKVNQLLNAEIKNNDYKNH